MHNKKLSLILLLFVAMTGYVHAQALSESLKITLDQVPAAVKKSYEKEFGEIPQEGKWTVRVTRTNENGRAVTNPVSYSYTNKVNKEKTEVRFSPEGEVLNSKGLVKKNDAGQTTEPGSSNQ
jgi:hypothetical protein